MHLRSLTACCLGGLLLALAATNFGCRRRDPYMDAYIEILNAEKRDMEDRIYELESELDQANSDLEAARARTPRTRTAPGTRPAPKPAVMPKVMEDSEIMPPAIDHGIPDEPKIEIPSVDPEPAPAAPKSPVKKPAPATRTMKPETARPEPLKLEPQPMLEPTPMGEEADEEFQPPKLSPDVPPSETLPAPPASKELPFRKKLPADVEAIDPQVSRIFINPFHTTGIDLDQHPGDDALRLLIEPRNALGQFIPQAGEVSVVLLDPAKTGDAARVARWDLDKQRVGEGLLEARPDRGIKLELPWPEKAPDNGKLKLFVRYTGATGETIETSSDVFVSVAGQLSQRWTPSKK